MIRFTTGNLLEAEVEALVNTVNCVGVMGRGIALQFKEALPANFKAYQAACKKKEVQPGRMFIFDTGELTLPRYIINFPTKRHWRGKSRIADIDAGLKALVRDVKTLGIRSIALPPLGSGLGGLKWADVRRLIEEALDELSDTEVLIFEPSSAIRSEVSNASKPVPTMTPGRAALISLMSRYLAGMMDPSISLLEVHKLMYLLQSAGEPLRLRYKAALYGPYAENLRHVLREIEGHLISGYLNDGDSPNSQLTIVPGAENEAEKFLESHRGTLERFERVTKLVEGFESPFGLELLATVHWVITHEHLDKPNDIVSATHAWNDRKRQFTTDQIDYAAKRLTDEGWTKVSVQ